MGRIIVLATALTIGHVLVVSCVGGAHLGSARAVRESPNPNPFALRVITATSDVLMFPTSLVWWLWRGERLPLSGAALLMTSPIWGFGLAYLLQRQRGPSDA